MTHAPAGDPDVVPTGMRATLGFFGFLEIRGLLVGAGIGRSRCLSVDPAKQVMPGNAGAAFILGGFTESSPVAINQPLLSPLIRASL